MADFSKILLGEGKLYADYGEVGELELGYVRGGTFNENLTIRHIEVDGKKGMVAGDAVVETVDPQLDVTMMEVNSANMVKVFTGLQVADAAGIKTITRSLVIDETDYLTNITYVGATKAGKECSIKLLNASGEGSLQLAFADKSEVEIPITMKGNYTSVDDTTAPYELVIDETV